MLCVSRYCIFKNYPTSNDAKSREQSCGYASILSRGNVRKYSQGGGVPAMVSNGEYVMGRDAVNKYGGSFMHGLNAGGNVPAFSNGGKLEGFQYKSGRAYQSKKMSGAFYGRADNVGLREDASSLAGALADKRAKEEEAIAKAKEEAAKYNARVQQIVSTVASIAMAGVTAGMRLNWAAADKTCIG